MELLNTLVQIAMFAGLVIWANRVKRKHGIKR